MVRSFLGGQVAKGVVWGSGREKSETPADCCAFCSRICYPSFSRLHGALAPAVGDDVLQQVLICVCMFCSRDSYCTAVLRVFDFTSSSHSNMNVYDQASSSTDRSRNYPPMRSSLSTSHLGGWSSGEGSTSAPFGQQPYVPGYLMSSTAVCSLTYIVTSFEANGGTAVCRKSILPGTTLDT